MLQSRRAATAILCSSWLALLAACGSAPEKADTASAHVGHVFVVVLENEDFDNSFGADSPAAYLARTLPSQGAMLRNYYGIGHNSLDNYLAMISGQGPNIDTQADCRDHLDFSASGALDADGQLPGHGCVYPAQVRTLPDQLEQAGLSWRGYMEDMGRDPRREDAACGAPAIGPGDPARRAVPGDAYATKHNPFAYFHGIVDDAARCRGHVVNLDRLKDDLASADTTPNLVFIAPGLCHDGHDSPCASGEPGGLVSADAFLRQWLPLILQSPAFRQDGVLVVTFDESSGPQTDSSACCGESAGPNTAQPGITGPGGGRIGAVLLSPWIEPGTVTQRPYNHYSLLRSIEDWYGLPHLGYAGAAHQSAFGADVFTRRQPLPLTSP